MTHIKKKYKNQCNKKTESTLIYKFPYKKILKSIIMTNETQQITIHKGIPNLQFTST